MPGNELGDRVHNFFVTDNSPQGLHHSRGMHHSQIAEGNWPLINNNVWIGSQRKFDVLNSDSKNYVSQISDSDREQGCYPLNDTRGLNLTQATTRPEFAKSQYQSEQPNLNGYVFENQFHQTRKNEEISLAVDTESDQHHLTTTRGLSIHEIQKGSGLEPRAKTSLKSEAISPISFDFFGGQQQMSLQQSSMMQSLQYQQSGLNEMQQVQQEVMLRKMQEIQRQQQLGLRQQNLINQIFPFAKQALDSQSSVVMNSPPNSDALRNAWTVENGNTNWFQRVSSTMQGSPGGLVFTPHGQTQSLVGLVPQVDQSLYGVPVSSSRGLALSQHSQMGSDRSSMLQVSTVDNSLPGQYTVLPDQISAQDRSSISGQRFQNENMFGHSSSETINIGIDVESLQHVNPIQRNTQQQDFWGRQEPSVQQETSPEKPRKQVAFSPNESTLNPMEEKILFGSDDNILAAFGNSNNMSREAGNLFDNGGLLNEFPSIQSGSWSALMQSAAAETSSSDIGMQEEWTGLSINNAEVPLANQHPPMYNNNGKREASLADGNMHMAFTMGSGSVPASDDANINNYQNFMGFNQFVPTFRDGPGQRLRSDKSQRPVSLEEAGKWPDSSSLQRSVAEGSQMYRNASQHSFVAEKNAKSISTPWTHEGIGAREQPNGWNALAPITSVEGKVMNAHEIGNLSQNSQSNPIRAMHGEVDNRNSIWKSNPVPSLTFELDSMKSSVGSSQVNKGGLSLNDAASVPNPITRRVGEKSCLSVQNNYLLHEWKGANSLAKSQGVDGLGRMLHQVNKGNKVLDSLNNSDKEAVTRCEMQSCDLKENLNDSHHPSNLSQHTSGGLRGSGFLDASDLRSQAAGKQMTISQLGLEVAGPHKVWYRPVGNLDKDVKPSNGLKQANHVERMSPQNTNFGQSKFLQGQSSDLQRDHKSPDEGPSLENHPDYAPNMFVCFSRSGDTYPANKASPSSQNMLDLFHKVDQSRDHGTVTKFDSSKGNEPSQLHVAETCDGPVGHRTHSSDSQGFGLQLGPPSQRVQIPDQLVSSKNAQHTYNSSHSSHAAGVNREDQHMAPTSLIHSFPISNEQSQTEFVNSRSGILRQTGFEASPYKMPENLSSELSSGHSRIHLQNQQITMTYEQGTSQEVGINGLGGPAATLSAKDHVPSSQPFAMLGISSAQILHNMWANVPAHQNALSAPYHKVLSQYSESRQPNVVESRSSIPLTQGDASRQGKSITSEFGAISTNSQSISGEQHSLKESSSQHVHSVNLDPIQNMNQSLGKTASIKNQSDDSPTNSASTQIDIEVFGQSLKPNSFTHKNYAINQRWVMKDTESDPNNRVSKRIKGSDSGLGVHQVALEIGDANERGALVGDSLGSSTVGTSGDDRTLGFSKPADLLKSSISSQHGNMASQLPFSQDVSKRNFSQNVSQSNFLSDSTYSAKVEHHKVSPQMAPSWFNQYGTFRNGQISHTVTSSRTAEEQPFALWKSARNSHALGSVDHGTAAAVDACRVDSVRQCSTSAAVPTGPKKRKSATSELYPWHKEILQSSQNLQTFSLAEVQWAKAANHLTEKVDDDVELIEDGPPMQRSKRRLVLTTQLMQQLLRPPPPTVLSSDASSDYESVTYSISRMALGDACSAVSCSRNSNMACNGVNLLSAEAKTSTRNGDKVFAEVVEEMMRRATKLENDFLRLDNCSSILDLKVECQDLEKFSVINRFGKFHGRGQTDNPETASMIDVMTSSQRSCPQRYVAALPMPRNVPERVQCLSL